MIYDLSILDNTILSYHIPTSMVGITVIMSLYIIYDVLSMTIINMTVIHITP